MNFFMHYKNKPYKYVGEAKHSETLEDMVVYEALYENPIGKTWVRPKKMFFEKIEINGSQVARFRKVDLRIENLTTLTPSLQVQITGLAQSLLTSWNSEKFAAKLEKNSNRLLTAGFIEDRLVGFKLGFVSDDKSLDSWLGGVHKDFQGVGIAQALMISQHEWCRNAGLKRITTKSQNDYRPMLHLNINNGFNIIGTETTPDGRLKILFEKNL